MTSVGIRLCWNRALSGLGTSRWRRYGWCAGTRGVCSGSRFCSAITHRTSQRSRTGKKNGLIRCCGLCEIFRRANHHLNQQHHPCQALANADDSRKAGAHRKRVVLTWAWHPKPLPMAVPNSFALAAAQMGHDLVIGQPEGYELDDDLMTGIQERSAGAGGTVEVTHSIEAAFAGADVIYAKSWGSKQFYGAPESDIEKRAQYRVQWIVDGQKMARTNGAIFMHCLPVRRNVIVTDDVIDSPASVVIDEAENRLHVQKAIMKKVMSTEC